MVDLVSGMRHACAVQRRGRVPCAGGVEDSSEDAHDYCMNGCNQIDIQGKSHMGLEDGEISVAKCLGMRCLTEFACTPKTACSPYGRRRNFSTFEELMDAYRNSWIGRLTGLVRLANQSQRIYGEYAPNLGGRT